MGQAARKRGAPARGRSRRSSRKLRAQKEAQPEVSFLREGAAIFFVVLGVFLAASLYSYFFDANYETPFEAEPGRHVHSNLMGPIGERTAGLLARVLGWCSFFLVLWSFLLSFRMWRGGKRETEESFFGLMSAIIGSVVLVGAAACFTSVIAGFDGGGVLGSSLAYVLIELVNEPGTLLISGAAFLLSLGVASGTGTLALLERMKAVVERGLRALASYLRRVAEEVIATVLDWGDILLERSGPFFERIFSFLTGIAAKFRRTDEDIASFDAGPREPAFVEESCKNPKKAKVRVSRRKNQEIKPRKKIPRVADEDSGAYESPSIELLYEEEHADDTGPADSELIENSKRLEKTLLDFKIGGKVVEVQPGPVITLYHFEPAAGVKVQRIVGLADDLALALKVASVRVYAPVPGKGTVGIEVPNASREIVRLREILASSEFMQSPKRSVTLGFGKDTFGSPAVADLARMPHLLIAGATGTGKSVGINSMLLSLLYRHSPDELQLILIDPKMLELSLYEGIPHLRAPVVTNPKKARGVLYWAVEEMERRYQAMKDLGVRNLHGFNKEARKRARQQAKAEEGEVAVAKEEEVKPLPRIVIVVDELADLMLSVGREIEELLTRLAQKARASGIHLILATQRPSVNVITGLIKANFPARLSFKVATRIDSRTVLDTSGAERLLGEGDLLFLSPISGKLSRLHGAYVSDEEVQEVVDYLKGQGTPRYDDDIEAAIERIEQADSGGAGLAVDEEYDPLYDDAVRLVTDKGQASTSMVQRAFRIGYNRAARILDTMEREGVVGPADGAKPREVFPQAHGTDMVP